MTRTQERRVSWVLPGLLATLVALSPLAVHGQTEPQPQPPQAKPPGSGVVQAPGAGAAAAHLPEYQLYYQNYAPGYPAPEVGVVPTARAQAQALYWQNLRAEEDLNKVVDDAIRHFRRSEPTRQAYAQEQDAWTRYDAARQHALESLSEDSDYQALVSLKQQLERRIAEARRERRPDMKVIQAMALTKLTYATQATAREQAVLSRNQEVQQSRQQFVDAALKKEALREQFRSDLADSAELAVARRRVQDTRIASLAADAYLGSVLEARDIALDYADDAQDYYNPWNSYPPYYQNYPAWWLSESR